MLQAAPRSLRGYLGTIAVLLACAVAPAEEAPVVARASFPSGAVLRPDAGISIVLARVPAAAEGRLAVFLGDADWTDVFVAHGNELRLSRGLLPIPEGESTLRVYLVPPQGDWKEVFAQPFRVEPRPRPTTTPSLDVLLRRQFAEFHRPDEVPPSMAAAPVIGGPQQPPPPQVGTFSAISGQGGLETTRPLGAWSLQGGARRAGHRSCPTAPGCRPLPPRRRQSIRAGCWKRAGWRRAARFRCIRPPRRVRAGRCGR
jgi:hypothetical protein